MMLEFAVIFSAKPSREMHYIVFSKVFFLLNSIIIHLVSTPIKYGLFAASWLFTTELPFVLAAKIKFFFLKLALNP